MIECFHIVKVLFDYYWFITYPDSSYNEYSFYHKQQYEKGKTLDCSEMDSLAIATGTCTQYIDALLGLTLTTLSSALPSLHEAADSK